MPKLKLSTDQKKQIGELYKEYRQNSEDSTLSEKDKAIFENFCEAVLAQHEGVTLAKTTPKTFLTYVDELDDTFTYGESEYKVEDLLKVLDAAQEQKSAEASPPDIGVPPPTVEEESDIVLSTVEGEPEEVAIAPTVDDHDPSIQAPVDFSEDAVKKLISNVGAEYPRFGDATKLESDGKLVGYIAEYKSSPEDEVPVTVKFLKGTDSAPSKILFSTFNEDVFKEVVKNMYDTYGPDVPMKLTGAYTPETKALAEKILREERETRLGVGVGLEVKPKTVDEPEPKTPSGPA